MQSMTGYFTVSETTGQATCTVELRSVNNRYLDTNVRMPHYMLPYEGEIRSLLQAAVPRGKVDIYIDIRQTEHQPELSVNEELAVEYYEALSRIRKRLAVEQAVPLSAVFSADGVIQQNDTVDADAVWKELKPLIHKGIKGLVAIKQEEGAATQRDLEEILGRMRDEVEAIRKSTEHSVTDYRAELEKRLQRIVGREVDENMLLSEAGILAARADINEELARLASHFDLFEKNLESSEPVGRTLDFISQEMNREINTIGSKQTDYAVSEKVILLKSGLEKIREQIRNIE